MCNQEQEQEQDDYQSVYSLLCMLNIFDIMRAA